MKNPINRNVFDSRDLIEYKEFLESDLLDEYNSNSPDSEELEDVDNIPDDYGSDLFNEYKAIRSFCDELEGSGDYEYGDAIIHEDYFTEYAEELCKDCGEIPEDLPWYIANHIDWDGVAGEIMADYIEAEYEGETYYMRA